MKNMKSIIWGLVLIAVGVILAGNAVDLFDIDVFFDGWWTLFIIVPCLAGVLTDSDKKGSIIGLVIGVLLLLACQDILNFDIIWKLLLPIIVICIGLSIIFKNAFDKEIGKNIDKLNKKLNKDNGYCATFSGQNIKIDEDFTGTNLNAIFGGIDIDLRKAKIKDDALINVTSVFGGVDIFLPEDVRVKVKSNSIFGGVSNKKEITDKKDSKTIYINATCIFGGVEIK